MTVVSTIEVVLTVLSVKAALLVVQNIITHSIANKLLIVGWEIYTKIALAEPRMGKGILGAGKFL